MFNLIKSFFTNSEQKTILEKVAQIEKDAAADVHIHIFRKESIHGIFQDTQATFEKLGLAKTKRRNTVLVFIATASRQIACFGDIGISEVFKKKDPIHFQKLETDFWNEFIRIATTHFKDGQRLRGIIEALDHLHKFLKLEFPNTNRESGEIADQITES